MSQKDNDTGSEFSRRDFAEIALGGSIMAFPVATTEEVWNLGTELSLLHVMMFTAASMLVLALTIYGLHYRAEGIPNRKAFIQRLVATYGATLLISAALLYGVGRFDILHDSLTSLKRAILVAYPASFAATAVDSLGSRK